MKTSALPLEAFSQSVLAVPPLARDAELRIHEAANRQLIRHIEAGGIRILLYGGNANLYHLPPSEFEPLLDLLADAAGPDTWVIPSIGPDYGKMIEQAAVLRRSRYRTAMVLPMQGFTSPEGVAEGLRRVSDKAGMPLTLYIKSEGYIDLERLQSLVQSGHILCIKYAVVRADAAQDAYLQGLIERIGRERIVSGMGERPVLAHVGRMGLASFTTGSGCIAPHSCMALLQALKRQDFVAAQALYDRFMPLETLRDSVSLIRVLHDAVSWSGLADMGPQLPLLSPTPADKKADVQAAALALLEHDRRFARTPQA
jgi:dihydrodipicolinate synthase/N-acetylneuraminate lyase